MSDALIAMGVLREPHVLPATETSKRALLRQSWNSIKCDVVLKMSFPKLYKRMPRSKEPKIEALQKDGLECEIDIYNFVSQLVVERVSPNFVLGLAYWQCPNLSNLVAKLDQKERKTIKTSAKNIAKENRKDLDWNNMPVNMLLLERGRGADLHELLDQNINEQAVLSILFQVLYTLNVLNRRNIRHADLHIGNIFVDILSTTEPPTFLTYVLSDGVTFYRVPTYNLIAKIYDWDWGGVYGYSEKEKFADEFVINDAWPAPSRPTINAFSLYKNYCDTASTCGKNSKADAFTFLINLHTRLNDMPDKAKYSKAISFIEQQIDADLMDMSVKHQSEETKKWEQSAFEKAGGSEYRLCQGVFQIDPNDPEKLTVGTKCIGPWEPNDSIMSSIDTMIRSSFWNPWRRTKEEIVTLNDANMHIYGDWTSREQRDALLQSLENQCSVSLPVSEQSKSDRKRKQ